MTEQNDREPRTTKYQPRHASPPFYDITRGDWRVVAEETSTRGTALIRFWRKGEPFKEFEYPAYKVWNISAHFHHITEDFEQGMALASATGFESVSS